ncbi:hypothetical protein [Lysobacter gummosus]|uniref:hypothetical protein n=1 Tax=Lysobacter gummosus TaxID=262324 RepID=UPI00363714E6
MNFQDCISTPCCARWKRPKRELSTAKGAGHGKAGERPHVACIRPGGSAPCSARISNTASASATSAPARRAMST